MGKNKPTIELECATCGKTFVRHLCLNPSCVNPMHLEETTQSKHMSFHRRLRLEATA